MSDPRLTALGKAAVADHALPFLELVAKPERLRELILSRVLPLLAPRRDAAMVRVDDVTYTPGHKCVALCSLLTPDGGDAELQRAVVTMASGDRLAAVYDRTYSGKAPGSALFIPELDILAELFPADHALPTLADAASPERMSRVLQRLAELGDFERSPHVEILHYRPHRRCVFGYRFDGESGPEMVGKLYRPGPEAREAWTRLEFAHAQLAPREIAVPRPFPLVGHLNLLVMQRVSGTLFNRQLHQDAPSSARHEAVSLAARLLATLHSLHVEGAVVRTIDGELRTLRKRAEPLTVVAPEFAQRVQALLGQVVERASECATATPCFIHGDFTPSQVLITRDGAAILDFDLAGAGDPAIDVANFTTKLRRRARRTGDTELRSLATTFLDEYQQHARPDGSLARRVQVLESAALVRTAIRAFRHGPFSYADGTTPCLPQLFLDEAADSLSES